MPSKRSSYKYHTQVMLHKVISAEVNFMIGIYGYQSLLKIVFMKSFYQPVIVECNMLKI